MLLEGLPGSRKSFGPQPKRPRSLLEWGGALTTFRRKRVSRSRSTFPLKDHGTEPLLSPKRLRLPGVNMSLRRRVVAHDGSYKATKPRALTTGPSLLDNHLRSGISLLKELLR